MSSPSYSRYWRHYQQAMGWFQTHRRAYSKALIAGHSPACYGQPYPGQQYPGKSSSKHLYTNRHGWAEDGILRGRRGEKRYRESPEPLGREEEEMEEEEEEDSDLEAGEQEIECDVSNMEITEELRQYFAQTEKHREELSK